MSEGLRERKKRQTRQRIAETALGLFVARGFDNVTVSEIAAAAEVSVNTLYNYFEAKEDLVLPPDEASAQRLADIVRARRPGESAARAVLDRLRDELRRHDRKVGLGEGFGPVFAMMRAAPTLTARLEHLGRQMTDALAAVLAEETGAGPDDLTSRVVAGQIGWFHALVFAEIGNRLTTGDRPETIAAKAIQLLDAVDGLLSERVLSYATRTA